MTKHSQDKGSTLHKAMTPDVVTPDVVKYAIQRHEEAVARRERNYEREQRANDLYEHLRLLSKDQLAALLGYRDARPSMIGALIFARLEAEDQPENQEKSELTEDVKKSSTLSEEE